MKKFYDIDKQSPLKKKAFVLLHKLWRSRDVNNNVYFRVVVALETLQLCWYSIAPKFVHNPSAMQWLEKTLYAIQVDKALDQNNEKVLLSLLYIVFGWQMLILVASYYILSKAHKSKSAILRFVNTSAILTTYWLALPIFQIYLTALICVDDRQANGDLVCYKGIYFLHFVIALIGFLTHVGTSVLVMLFFCDLNPFSTAGHASPQNRPQLYRLWIKLVLALFGLLTYPNENVSIVVYFYGVLWLGALIYRWRQIPDFTRSNYSFRVGAEALILWLVIYELVRLVS